VIADRDASEISPVVTLLAGAATAIALAFAGAAVIFLVRRRSVEAALLYARGGVELLLPTAAGAPAGFGLALAATSVLASSGSIDAGTIDRALRNGALGALVALVLAALAATVAFVRQFDSGTRDRPWLGRIPWELPLLIAAGWLLYDLLSGGGLAGQASGAGHPTFRRVPVPAAARRRRGRARRPRAPAGAAAR
jgi:hypothetical protein